MDEGKGEMGRGVVGWLRRMGGSKVEVRFVRGDAVLGGGGVECGGEGLK